MKNFKRLLCLVMALCIMGAFTFTAFAEDGKIDIETENDCQILDMTHIDVKADAKYYAEIDGEKVVLDAKIVAESIVVTVATPNANLNYSFANYKVYTLVEDGMTEYRIVLDGTDGALLTAIQWDGYTFRMKNVYVGARLVFDEVPEVLAAEMEQTEDGAYYVDVNMLYNGIQECTTHNGLRSEGHCGYITGVDLYLGYVPGLSVETPVPETTEPQPTEPQPTEPQPTEPQPTEPQPTEPQPTEPQPTEPQPTEPQPTEPPVDDVPDTGDSANKTMLMVLMAVSALGMAATAVVCSKMKYVGKWH